MMRGRPRTDSAKTTISSWKVSYCNAESSFTKLLPKKWSVVRFREKNVGTIPREVKSVNLIVVGGEQDPCVKRNLEPLNDEID